MTEIMLSIRPKWCELIAIGLKTIEVRKTKPKCDVPFKVYIYCTKQRVNGEILLTYDKRIQGRNKGFRDVDDIPLAGKVIGEFVCDKMIFAYIDDFDYPYYDISVDDLRETCLSQSMLFDYAKGEPVYGWHISDIIIYDKPKDLSDFYKPCIYGKESDVSCFLCNKSGYRPDMYIDCFNKVTRPPQSWCYVEKDRESNDTKRIEQRF